MGPARFHCATQLSLFTVILGSRNNNNDFVSIYLRVNTYILQDQCLVFSDLIECDVNFNLFSKIEKKTCKMSPFRNHKIWLSQKYFFDPIAVAYNPFDDDCSFYACFNRITSSFYQKNTTRPSFSKTFLQNLVCCGPQNRSTAICTLIMNLKVHRSLLCPGTKHIRSHVEVILIFL